MYCLKCGKENPEDVRFCMHCGADLSGYKIEISPRIEVSPRVIISTVDKEQSGLLVEDKPSKALEKEPAVVEYIRRKKKGCMIEEEHVIDTLLSAEGRKYLNLSKYTPHTLEGCVEFFDELLEERPEIKNDEWFWSCKCIILLEQGKYDEALESCDKMLDINPRAYAGWHNKGVISEHFKRWEEANLYFDKALEINPKSSETWAGKCNVLLKGRVNAIKHFLEDETKGLGSIKRLEGIDREAMRCVNKALEINPKNEHAWILKSVSEVGGKNESIRCLDKALEINPRSVEALVQMGLKKFHLAMDYKRGREPYTIVWDKDLLWDAITWFNESLRIDPYHTIALKTKEEALEIIREL
jgi:tetratricopeptide (TPR) repeat protein